MSDFDAAIRIILQHEGGLVDDPDDPGGLTNYGISLRYLRRLGLMTGDLDGDGDIDAADIRAMTLDDAIEIYRRQWWFRYRYGEIRVQSIATKTFDLAVNMGASQAHKCLQRAARSVGVMLIDDGILGPKTRQAINGAHPESLLAATRSEAAGIYRQIVAKRPSSKKFLTGWLSRAYS